MPWFVCVGRGHGDDEAEIQVIRADNGDDAWHRFVCCWPQETHVYQDGVLACGDEEPDFVSAQAHRACACAECAA